MATRVNVNASLTCLKMSKLTMAAGRLAVESLWLLAGSDWLRLGGKPGMDDLVLLFVRLLRSFSRSLLLVGIHSAEDGDAVFFGAGDDIRDGGCTRGRYTGERGGICCCS